MKKILVLLMTLAICFSLAACGGENEKAFGTELEGTYAHSHFYEGSEFVTIISLKPDGTYQKLTLKDDYIKSLETGDYELTEEKVYLYDSDAIVYHGSATLYTFEKGNLQGPESVYKKISEN